MKSVEELMHSEIDSIGVRDTMDIAAAKMRQRDIGSLPICDGEGRPVGIVTDRDIVVECLALGHHPETATAGEFAQGDELRTVDIGAGIDEALAVMRRYQIRRLPVTDHGRLAGMITEADIARGLPDADVAGFVEAVCAQKLPATTS
ncbi:CBS domain-containing protein [Nocardia sp. NPDC003963]